MSMESILNRLDILERKTDYLRDMGIGPPPGDVEGLGTVLLYIVGLGVILFVGGGIINGGVYVWDKMVVAKKKK